MNQHKEAKKDSIVLSKTRVKKIFVTIVLSLVLFFVGIFIEDVTTFYVVCGLFSTPVFCAYLLAKYMFGGEKNA